MSKEHMLGKIIDFEVKCNRVRFYIGLKDSKWGWTNKDYVDENGNKPVGLKPHDDYYGNNWDAIPYKHTKICQICQRHWQNLSNIRCNSKFSTTCGKVFRMLNLCPNLVRK